MLLAAALGACTSMTLRMYAAHKKLELGRITTQEIKFAHPLMHRREMTLLASRNALSADFTRPRVGCAALT